MITTIKPYRASRSWGITRTLYSDPVICFASSRLRVREEKARQGHFTVRLWESGDLVEAIYRTYEQLPAEIQAELPLKRVWMLVQEGDDA